MSIRRLTVSGPASPELAWARYERPSQWRTWAPQITGVDASTDHLEQGLHGVVHAVGVPVDFVVTAVDAAQRSWSWIVRIGPLTLTLHHTVEPEEDGSAASLVLEGPALVVTTYAPLARLALRRLVS